MFAVPGAGSSAMSAVRSDRVEALAPLHDNDKGFLQASSRGAAF
ncbi:MAG: hypothetical protein OJF48_004799 [Afipia sp.]|nr:MAG: hypothetical protein OJF48_004799 [Afipia sp.]